jgi:hypothetical protein
MEPNWAAENLQVIRTLMERAALYRRALAPVMLLTGTVGVIAAAAGLELSISTPRGFAGFWLAVSVTPVIGALWIVRRQALRDGEPLWSPPARRVAQAVAPGFVVGLVLGLAQLQLRIGGHATLLPALWAICYGGALHAAGFFTPRGLRWFGWIVLLTGLGALLVPVSNPAQWPAAHLAMGLCFGVLHLLYGAYLYATEHRKHVA